MKAINPHFRSLKTSFFSVGTLVLLASASASAGTTTVFAPGVTRESGWYDVNKKSTEQRPEKDFTYCWAASASNLIDYWESRYVAAGNNLPNTIPSLNDSPGGYESSTFDIFLDDSNWNSVVNGSSRGADQRVALKWYFNGEGHTFSGNYALPVPGTGGYWKSEYTTIQKQLGDNFIQDEISGYSTWGGYASDKSVSTIKIFSEVIQNILSKGAAGFGANTSLRGGHAFTLWGADFDSVGLVTKVYITDSDDAERTLTASGLREYEITYDDFKREIYLSNTDYGNKNLITNLYGLSVYPIPEPSAFGLLAGVFAVGMACSRRKARR